MTQTQIVIPECSLVFLIGTSGSGKTTFARKHFKQTEVLSSDFFRGLIADDENDQTATQDAFEVLHLVAEKRMASGRTTVIDATNVRSDARKPLLDMALDYDFTPIAIVLDLPLDVCLKWNSVRPD
ncbi:MAG TPA: AAA family ATPase, partial [bacterium]|nr:AAA family ATPase [bacterium]